MSALDILRKENLLFSFLTGCRTITSYPKDLCYKCKIVFLYLCSTFLSSTYRLDLARFHPVSHVYVAYGLELSTYLDYGETEN